MHGICLFLPLSPPTINTTVVLLCGGGFSIEGGGEGGGCGLSYVTVRVFCFSSRVTHDVRSPIFLSLLPGVWVGYRVLFFFPANSGGGVACLPACVAFIVLGFPCLLACCVAS